MITTVLLGGLGNNLFQIANALARGQESGMPVSIMDSVERFHFGPLNGSLELEVPRIFERVDYLTKARLPIQNFRVHSHADMTGGYFGYTKPPLPIQGEDLCYVGYFQSHRYFDNLDRSWMKLKQDLIQRVKDRYEIDRVPSIAVHWRAGGDRNRADTLPYHSIVSMDFYREAISIISEQKGIHPRIYVISQGTEEEVMRGFAGLASEVKYVNDSVENSFAIMALCPAVILGNSTFSWWAAMANDLNPIVVAPKTEWFGPKNSHLSKDDLFPESWICL